MIKTGVGEFHGDIPFPKVEGSKLGPVHVVLTQFADWIGNKLALPQGGTVTSHNNNNNNNERNPSPKQPMQPPQAQSGRGGKSRGGHRGGGGGGGRVRGAPQAFQYEMAPLTDDNMSKPPVVSMALETVVWRADRHFGSRPKDPRANRGGVRQGGRRRMGARIITHPSLIFAQSHSDGPVKRSHAHMKTTVNFSAQHYRFGNSILPSIPLPQ
ncbi:hypothetical protein BJ684DRAFT_14630 [Piptocephalis cylindrospora]|uniref:Uncharacterized protein n=1 Tax=Piptocephalis cylindrospora TaxID=1907219 RepID=A0A4P9YAH1_9FUNG|nr:hypothetical protein BJ684DRAFT_14630 [Piptocephalis cylindrospora]|eukprot:RKP15080.1 hypothetical protein BJ684DRAFT_14630 [Piptocephalis cylindrospora]